MTINETNQNHREVRGVMQPQSIEEVIEALPIAVSPSGDKIRVLTDEQLTESPDLEWHVRNYPEKWERSLTASCHFTKEGVQTWSDRKCKYTWKGESK